jgi:hypothetical protein
MRYRTLSVSATQQIAAQFVAGEHAAVEVHSVDHGEGSALDETPLISILDMYKRELEDDSPSDKEIFEGRLAAAIFSWLDSLPVEVLDDPGFWRYLSVKYFWWFVEWREQDPISRGNFDTLVDATLPAEQIPLRMYLRAKSIADGTDASLAGQIPKSMDFWRSHVVRVRVGSAPNIARAFAISKRDEEVLGQPLKTERLRRVARRINRMWSNVYLDLYDKEEGDRFVKEIIEADK